MNIKLTLLLSFFLMSLQAQRTVGLFENDSLAFNGYTLWTPNNSTYLIDNCGHLIKEWQSAFRPGLSVYLLENGHLLRTGGLSGAFNGAGRGGIIEEFNWEGERIWHYEVASSEFHQHHDIEPMPNGNILVIAWEKKNSAEAREAGSSRNVAYWPEVIFELEKLPDNEAKVVWEWHAWDHLIQDHDSTEANFGVVKDHPELFNINYRQPSGGSNGDWLHFNGIFYDEVRDEIILSARNFNEIYIIDHSTSTEEAAGHTGGQHGKGGDILYRWGNPEAYGRGTLEHRKLFGQHDARIIEAGHFYQNQISIFNNGAGRPGSNFSSIEVIEPPIDDSGYYQLGQDSIYGPDQPSWQYTAPVPTDFYSNNMAGVHALPNNNFLICEANKGKFFEVSLDGGVVWTYQNPATNSGPIPQGTVLTAVNTPSVFRATRYAPDYPGLSDKDLTPGPPIELDPLPSECMIFGEQTSAISEAVTYDFDLKVSHDNNGIHIWQLKQKLLTIELMDFSGRAIQKKISRDSYTNLNTLNLVSGIYILHVTDGSSMQTFSQKIFIGQ
ncbi:MAG: T9SS type A sorting domain-containing protein [Saprospiraceae bacterium]|nr:T9SS type A sorting domain-containing protein [Saprospiraceae bacterium]